MEYTITAAGLIVSGKDLNPFDVKVPIQSEQVVSNKHIPVALQTILDISNFAGPHLVHILSEELFLNSLKSLPTPIPETNIFKIQESKFLYDLVSLAQIVLHRYGRNVPVIMFPAAYHITSEDRNEFIGALTNTIQLAVDGISLITLGCQPRRIYHDVLYLNKKRKVSDSNELFTAELVAPNGNIDLGPASKTVISTNIFAFRPAEIIDYVKSNDSAWHEKIEAVQWGKEIELLEMYHTDTNILLNNFLRDMNLHVYEGKFDWYPLRSMKDISLIPNLS